MKVDSTTQVLQVLKKVCPFDTWREAQGYNGDVLKSEASVFKKQSIGHASGRMEARETLHGRFSRTVDGRFILVALSEQMDKVRLVAEETVS